MIQLIANSITIICLTGVIICGLIAIRRNRKAAANWKRAEASWKEAEANWERAAEAKELRNEILRNMPPDRRSAALRLLAQARASAHEADQKPPRV
ncbi:hypothetical protein [Nocardiopsis synnemataformans]|uniref:hypothetical protein n=1 Tax=Nocardiopsis synnemataformans TaxID=61305 RepID=UPI003EBE6024